MLFDGVEIGLESRVRACLVGRNGAGKTTLLRVLAGEIEPDDGERVVTPGTRVAFVPQEPIIVGETVLDHATAGGAQDYEAEAMLDLFAIPPSRSAKGLSGGEIRRVALARALAEDPDVLLLDEPTNHLDILAIETLEAELSRSKAAILIVSHDRAFLERVTGRCFWLEHRKVRALDRDFSAFDDWVEKILAGEAEESRRLDKQLEREEYWLQRGVTGRRARNEGRRRALMDLRKVRSERLKDTRGDMNIGLASSGMSGKRVVEVKDLAKSFGDRVLLKGFSTRILRGDRVAIVGPNGAGKTTLVKLLLGELAPDSGSVQLGANLDIAYIDQSRIALKPDMMLRDVLTPLGGDQVMVRGQPRHVNAYAKDFLFTESQIRQPVKSLSGGERNRLLLARALATPANLLVLDEPTNDLDMDTRGEVAETPGGWQDFLSQNPDFFRAKAPRSEPTRAPPPKAQPPKVVKLSYKDQRRLQELEALVADLPAKIKAIEVQLAAPNLYSANPSRFASLTRDLEATQAMLASAEEEWLIREEQREALEKGT